MKKILLIVLAILVIAGLVTFMVIKQQSGYTKVLTAKIVRQDLATVVSGTGQIKPKTYVNLGATAMGRITHFYVHEGDKVKKGQTVASIENAKADLEQKQLDWDRAQGLYKAGIMAKQDYDAKKAAYDLDVATVAQTVAQLNQAKANTDSARGHMQTQQATLRANLDMLSRTLAVAPFDGIVTHQRHAAGRTRHH